MMARESLGGGRPAPALRKFAPLALLGVAWVAQIFPSGALGADARDPFSAALRSTDSNNAIRLYAQAAKKLDPPLSPEQNQMLDAVLAKNWLQSATPLVELFKQHRDAMDLVRQGAALDSAAFPRWSAYGPQGAGFDFAKVQTLGRLLCAAGRFREGAGEPGAAARNYLAATALARDLSASNTTLRGIETSAAIRDTAARAIHDVVRLGGLQGDSLRLIVERLTAVDAATPPLSSAFLAEAEQLQHFLGQVQKAAAGDDVAKAWMSDRGLVIRDVLQIERALSELTDAHRGFYELSATFFDLAPWKRDPGPYKIHQERLEKALPKTVADKAPLPDLTGVDARYHVSQTRQRLALIHAALALYRLENGAWPEDLKALAPACLGKVPEDPYKGRPPRYAVAPDGSYALYGVGPDRSSQDGATAYNPSQGAGDIFFAPPVAPEKPLPPPTPTPAPTKAKKGKGKGAKTDAQKAAAKAKRAERKAKKKAEGGATKGQGKKKK
jgi:hypothetical protein